MSNLLEEPFFAIVEISHKVLFVIVIGDRKVLQVTFDKKMSVLKKNSSNFIAKLVWSFQRSKNDSTCSLHLSFKGFS